MNTHAHWEILLSKSKGSLHHNQNKKKTKFKKLASIAETESDDISVNEGVQSFDTPATSSWRSFLTEKEQQAVTSAPAATVSWGSYKELSQCAFLSVQMEVFFLCLFTFVLSFNNNNNNKNTNIFQVTYKIYILTASHYQLGQGIWSWSF